MRLIYRGGYRTFPVFNIEDLNKAIESGEWFRTNEFDFYYKSVPYNSSYEELPNDIVPLKRVCVTSVNSYWSSFYKITKSNNENAKIYIGADLENLILKELAMWAREINPKTLKAFGGKDFNSYLNAIPKEIILKDGFIEKMEEALNSGFSTRIRKENPINRPVIKTLQKLTTLSLSNTFKKRLSEQIELEKKLEEKFNKLKEKTL